MPPPLICLDCASARTQYPSARMKLLIRICAPDNSWFEFLYELKILEIHFLNGRSREPQIFRINPHDHECGEDDNRRGNSNGSRKQPLPRQFPRLRAEHL